MLYTRIKLSKNKIWKKKNFKNYIFFFLLNDLFSKAKYSTVPWVSTEIAGSKSWAARLGAIDSLLYSESGEGGAHGWSFLWYKTSISIDSPNPYNCFSPVQKSCRFKILFFLTLIFKFSLLLYHVWISQRETSPRWETTELLRDEVGSTAPQTGIQSAAKLILNSAQY